MSLQELRQKKHINPLIELINKAREATSLNTEDNKNRFCDCCFISVPLAAESYRIPNGFDCCIACKEVCDHCNTLEQRQEEAERIFRRSVIYSIEENDDHKIKWTTCTDCWQRRCCGACLTIVERVTPILVSVFYYPLVVCDVCILQIRQESANNFTNMQPFSLRKSVVGKKEECDCQKKMDFSLFD